MNFQVQQLLIFTPKMDQNEKMDQIPKMEQNSLKILQIMIALFVCHPVESKIYLTKIRQ